MTSGQRDRDRDRDRERDRNRAREKEKDVIKEKEGEKGKDKKVKWLICAECDLGPVGWGFEGGKEAWVGVERVRYGP